LASRSYNKNFNLPFVVFFKGENMICRAGVLTKISQSGFLFVLLTVSSFAQQTSPANTEPNGAAQTSPALADSTQKLIDTALEKAGIPHAYRPFTRCEADGTQTFGGDKNTTAQTHLETTNGGTTQVTVDLDGKKRSVLYSGASGVSTREDRSPAMVPTRTALLSELLYLPLLELAEIVHDPNSQIAITGPALIDGQTVYTFTAVGHWPDVNPDSLSPGPSVKYLIDAATSMIVSREDVIEDPKDSRTRYTRTYKYDDFRTSGAVILPHKVTEFLESQTITTTQWNTLTVSF
jgi:hypothetical protein